ncbi:hypothetical protein BN2497_1417 [Janthinobacterium sp. CG23_2]|nr:hypothetical protein BN2497_1417 [Janthinobacterium sp. CG23_2]CUU27106.1 hypothetical protein BN3177_1417 [Janthinobacterium sp. CG23_2]
MSNGRRTASASASFLDGTEPGAGMCAMGVLPEEKGERVANASHRTR